MAAVDELDWDIALEKRRLEALELRCERLGYREAGRLLYDARLRLSEACDALGREHKSNAQTGSTDK